METIPEWAVRKFEAGVHLEQSQTKARLRPYVEVKKIMNAKDATYNSLGGTRAKRKTDRNQKVEFSNIKHGTRIFPREAFYVALSVDKADIMATLSNIQGNYSKRVVQEMNRVFDRITVEAAIGKVKIGVEEEKQVSLTQDGGKIHDFTASEVDYDDLLEINQNYTDKEVGIDVGAKQILCVTGREEKAFMKDTKLTSGDFVRKKSVEDGEINMVAGNRLIKYGAKAGEPILKETDNYRRCVSMTENAVCVGIYQDMDLRIEKRTDLIDVFQIICTFYLGAIRTEGALVSEVRTKIN